MAFKLRVPNKTAVIVHPNDPDIRVEVVKPDIADIIEFQETMKKFVKREPAINPVTKEPIYRLGKLQVMEIQLPVSFNAGIDLIAKHIKNVSGMDQEFTPALSQEVLRRFLNPEFNFKETQDVQVLDEEGLPTGKVEQKEVDVNFCTYLANKVMSEETYGRPLESQTPSTNTASEG